jgi:DNA-binding MarR family transcriptional regulator
MTIEEIKAIFDACYLAKRSRDLLPPLPKGVTPSYIHYLDVIESFGQQGVSVKVSDISDALDIPRPGVTRTVKEMQAKGYLRKQTSESDGRVTYITVTEDGKKLSKIYNTQYFNRLLPLLEDISDEDAECTIRTIEKLYKVMSERSVTIE